MTPDELRDRILRWEDPHTDFKEAADSNSELAKDLVCFANSDGGQLVIGIAKDRSVVVLNIAKGDQRPYSTREGRYYIRSGARCRRASREELLRLFQSAHSLFYDEQPLPRLDLTDLDLDAVTRYLDDTNQVNLDEDLVRLLRAWRMYDGSHPTVGGLVLFGRRPQAELESSRVVVGAVSGGDIGDDFVDRKDLSGPLLSVIAQIETFLRLHLRTAHEIVGFEKEKREEIPMAALREAVVNALVHRDYTIAGPTRVFVLSDRVEVRSPGRPPNSVDAEVVLTLPRGAATPS
ncbi:MAG: AlbA family DNA-binding domain-containing protein [Pseudonocardiaceae bacterium]